MLSATWAFGPAMWMKVPPTRHSDPACGRGICFYCSSPQKADSSSVVGRPPRNDRMGKMRNPFQYGGVVRGSAFCNRTQEIRDLVRAAENAEKLFIYSERRMGKTSLVLHALRSLPHHAYTTAYVDL